METAEPHKTSLLGGGMGQVDIMKMLTKAQSEYDKVRRTMYLYAPHSETPHSETPCSETHHIGRHTM